MFVYLKGGKGFENNQRTKKCTGEGFFVERERERRGEAPYCQIFVMGLTSRLSVFGSLFCPSLCFVLSSYVGFFTFLLYMSSVSPVQASLPKALPFCLLLSFLVLKFSWIDCSHGKVVMCWIGLKLNDENLNKGSGSLTLSDLYPQSITHCLDLAALVLFLCSGNVRANLVPRLSTYNLSNWRMQMTYL